MTTRIFRWVWFAFSLAAANLYAQQPVIGENDWTFILAPSFETTSATGNLSVTGLNLFLP